MVQISADYLKMKNSTNLHKQIRWLIFLIIICTITLEFTYFNNLQHILSYNYKRKQNPHNKSNTHMVGGFSKGK